MKSIHTLAVAALAAALLSGCNGGGRSSSSGIVSPPPPVLPGRCTDFREGRKNAYFGDLHTHTSYSLDAYFFNALNDPRAAHRFAQGDDGSLPAPGSDDPYTAGRTVNIGRPLDFNAVTDHAEFLGGFVTLCQQTDFTQAQCDARIGKGIRDNIVAIANGDTPLQQQLLQSLIANSPTSATAWSQTLGINEDENRPCTYTTLNAYEYSSQESGQMFHRNVIFKGDARAVPPTVFSSVRPDTALNQQNGNDDWDLFDHLQQACLDTVPGCEVLTIPHNANLSDGRMWLPRDPATGLPPGRKLESTDVYMPMTTADAELRRSLDRLVEITQHKGQSECSIGLAGGYLEGEESSCDFEVNKSVCRGTASDPAACAQFCSGDPLTDPNFCSHGTPRSNLVDTCVTPGPDGASRPAGNMAATGTENCTHPLDYYRQAMAEGLAIAPALGGVNPYQINVSAASDTHSGLSGKVAEKNFTGHGGVLDDDPREQLGFWTCDAGDPADLTNCTNRRFVDFARPLNPGGLAGVWARENTRGEVFDALHRGETWGTSGTRMRVRTVGGWTLPANTCARLSAGENPVESGDVPGALMGGELPVPAPAGGAPSIAVWAQQDPEGHPLQRIDIVKGWVDATGAPRVKVFEGVARTSARVDRPAMDTCAVPVSTHPDQLCNVWTDPDFRAESGAYYYARVLEVPSCRWSAWTCNAQKKVSCGALDPATGMFPEASGFKGYEGCCVIKRDGAGMFQGRNTFATIEERAWASPIWYPGPPTP